MNARLAVFAAALSVIVVPSLFYVTLPDGRRLYHDIARPKGDTQTQ